MTLSFKNLAFIAATTLLTAALYKHIRNHYVVHYAEPATEKPTEV